MTETETKIRDGLTRYAEAMTVTRPSLDDLLSRSGAEMPEPGERSGARATAGLVRGPRGVRRSLVVGAGAMAVAAVLVVGIAVVRPHDGNGRDGSDVVARIIASTEQATTDSVVHMVRENPNGSREELWVDESGIETDERGMMLNGPAGSYRYVIQDVSGAVTAEIGGAIVPPSTGDEPSMRAVDHCRQRYQEAQVPFSGYMTTDPQFFLDMLEQGLMVEDGTEVVDGRELIRLRHREDDPGEGHLLVDPDTYLLTVVTNGGPGGFAGESTETYEYLPRTPENLEPLGMPAIPPGYADAEVDIRPDDPDFGSC
jgi:hypothetical protein